MVRGCGCNSIEKVWCVGIKWIEDICSNERIVCCVVIYQDITRPHNLAHLTLHPPLHHPLPRCSD